MSFNLTEELFFSITMFYKSTDVTIEKETLMVDFTGLISSGGGLLGLWLGLSCLDSVKLFFPFVTLIMKVFRKKQHQHKKIWDENVNIEKGRINNIKVKGFNQPNSAGSIKSQMMKY